jgi:hypothetical protein
MAKTEQEIRNIHTNKRAIYNKIYIGPNNVMYVGLRSGALQQGSDMKGEVIGNTLRSIINNIGSYTRDELITILGEVANKVDTVDFEEYKKEAKCFTIATAIALG